MPGDRPGSAVHRDRGWTVETLTATGGLTRRVLHVDIDVRPDEAQGVGVVSALRDDGADEGRDGVAGHAEPVGPGGPVAVVTYEGFTDVEDHSADHGRIVASGRVRRGVLPRLRGLGPQRWARCTRRNPRGLNPARLTAGSSPSLCAGSGSCLRRSACFTALKPLTCKETPSMECLLQHPVIVYPTTQILAMCHGPAATGCPSVLMAAGNDPCAGGGARWRVRY